MLKGALLSLLRPHMGVPSLRQPPKGWISFFPLNHIKKEYPGGGEKTGDMAKKKLPQGLGSNEGFL